VNKRLKCPQCNIYMENEEVREEQFGGETYVRVKRTCPKCGAWSLGEKKKEK